MNHLYELSSYNVFIVTYGCMQMCETMCFLSEELVPGTDEKSY